MHIFKIILDNTGVRDVGLQTARVAAFTEPSFGGDCRMTKLASTSEGAPIEVTVDYNAKSDTASDGHHQKMVIWLALAKKFLINCQAIDIIIKKDGDSKAIFQRTAN